MGRRPKTAVLPTDFKVGFLTSLDGRTELAASALKDRYDGIAADLGGVGRAHRHQAVPPAALYLAGSHLGQVGSRLSCSTRPQSDGRHHHALDSEPAMRYWALPKR